MRSPGYDPDSTRCHSWPGNATDTLHDASKQSGLHSGKTGSNEIEFATNRVVEGDVRELLRHHERALVDDPIGPLVHLVAVLVARTELSVRREEVRVSERHGIAARIRRIFDGLGTVCARNEPGRDLDDPLLEARCLQRRDDLLAASLALPLADQISRSSRRSRRGCWRARR